MSSSGRMLRTYLLIIQVQGNCILEISCHILAQMVHAQTGLNIARRILKFVGSNPATPTVKRGRNWPNEKGFNGGTPNVGGLCAR